MAEPSRPDGSVEGSTAPEDEDTGVLTRIGLGEPDDEQEPYHGGHRRDTSLLSRLAPYRMKVTIGALVALVLAIPIYTLHSLGGGGALPTKWSSETAQSEVPVPQPVDSTPTGLSATASASAHAVPTHTANPSPSPSVHPTTATPVIPPTTTTPPPPPPPPPPPVTYQAEAATRSGSAELNTPTCDRNRRVVRGIGLWPNEGPAGVLRFTNVTAPSAGPYQLTILYLNSLTENRTALIKVNNGTAQSVSGFGAAACVASRTVTVSLVAGQNSIEFGNPTGRAPTIDYIIVAPAG